MAGIADRFAAAGKLLWGPTQAAARLEGSKVFAKEFMQRQGIPTAPFRVFADAVYAVEYIWDRNCPLVVKADGLAGGKGVYVCDTADEAETAIIALMVNMVHGAAGERVVIEDKLVGTECSFFALVSGTKVVRFSTAVDYKRVYDGDQGPNTGGMGCYSPYESETFILREKIMNRIVLPTVWGMNAEGNPYQGFLYVGVMLTAEGPQVLEFNVRRHPL